MSILFECSDGIYIDNELYLNNLLRSLEFLADNALKFDSRKSFKCHPDLYNINLPFLYDSQFKKLHQSVKGDYDDKPNKMKKCKRKHDAINCVNEDDTVFNNYISNVLNKIKNWKQKSFIINNHSTSHDSSKYLFGITGTHTLTSTHVTTETSTTINHTNIAVVDEDKGINANINNNIEARNMNNFIKIFQEDFFNSFNTNSWNDGHDTCVDGNDNDDCWLDVIDLINPTKLRNRIVENSSDKIVFRKLLENRNDYYILPPHTKFILSNFDRIDLLVKIGTKFDCILMDPPWQNKSVKRKKSYSTFSMLNLSHMPIKNICTDGCLIGIWVTNKKKYQIYITNELFKKWNVQHAATWTWLKVTKSLTPIFPLHNQHCKKPYELLIFGRFKSEISITCTTSKINNNNEDIDSNCVNKYDDDDIKPINDKVIVSTPSSIHSHKPYLNEVLKNHLPKGAKCLELFARNLHPGWMSWGNEVFLLQNEAFFQQT